MIKVNGIEMEVVGVKRNRLICEYNKILYVGMKNEYVTFKIYKSKKGLYIKSGKRVYVDEEIRRCLCQSLGAEFIASMLTTGQLTYFLSNRGGVEGYYGVFEDKVKLTIETNGKKEEHDLVTPATILHVYD